MSPHHPLHPVTVVAVAVGGAIGAAARWSLGEAFPGHAGGFPWTTFSINVLGAFLLALLPAADWVRSHPVLPPALGTGVLGGFTTLSAYSEESRALAADGHLGTATAYVVGTVLACLLVVAVADRLSAPDERAELEAEEGDL